VGFKAPNAKDLVLDMSCSFEKANTFELVTQSE
jgi:hypothetical protein